MPTIYVASSNETKKFFA